MFDETATNAAHKNGSVKKASPRRGHIVALIPRGEVIRNFVHSGAFDEVAKNVELTLFSVSPSSEIEQTLRDRFGRVFPLSDIDERWVVKFQREILDISHNRWLWSKAAQQRWRLRDLEAVTIAQKSKRLLKRAVSYPFSNRTGLSLLEKFERSSSRRLNTTNSYTQLLAELRPSLVFNGSHIHSRIATQAVQAAQWLGIPTATFIFSWDNLTSQGRIMLPYDYYLVWNHALKEQLLAMYDWIKPEHVFITGTPQFDFHFRPEFHQDRDEYCQEIGADPKRPIIFYATGMPNHMPGETDIVERIADDLLLYPQDQRPQLLVRVYPKDRSGRFDELAKRRSDILFPKVAWEAEWLTPKYEDAFALANALKHCSLGINVASTVSLELCMFDKPVINVGYNPEGVPESNLSYANYYEFDHYKPIVESGAVQVAGSADEMAEMIKSCLQDPGVRSVERGNIVKEMFGSTLDGRSSERVAEVLTNLAAGSI